MGDAVGTFCHTVMKDSNDMGLVEYPKSVVNVTSVMAPREYRVCNLPSVGIYEHTSHFIIVAAFTVTRSISSNWI